MWWQVLELVYCKSYTLTVETAISGGIAFRGRKSCQEIILCGSEVVARLFKKQAKLSIICKGSNCAIPIKESDMYLS